MEVIIYCSAAAGAWPLSAERKIEVSAEQRLQMYVANGSDGRCIVAVRLIVGVRYLERPLREVLLYINIYTRNLKFAQLVTSLASLAQLFEVLNLKCII